MKLSEIKAEAEEHLSHVTERGPCCKPYETVLALVAIAEAARKVEAEWNAPLNHDPLSEIAAKPVGRALRAALAKLEDL